jgi:UDP-glucose 4-epimerase
LRILITGGAGFIGSHLTDRLLTSDHDALVIDNYETGRRDNLQSNPRLTVVEGSVCDEELMRKLFVEFRPHVVVHAAASYKDPENYVNDAQTNTCGTAIVAKNCNVNQVRRLIYLQTALCYGEAQEHPITLSHPLNPKASSYAISKLAGEHYVRLSGVENLTFRLANVYGPRNISGPLPAFYRCLTTKKRCLIVDTRRDFVYINDTIDILEKAVNGTGSTGAYHISSGRDFSIKELFDFTVASLGIELDAPVETRPRGGDDVATIVLDPTKTKKDFGIIPTFPLAEGVGRTLNYYKEYGVQHTYTHLRLEETGGYI